MKHAFPSASFRLRISMPLILCAFLLLGSTALAACGNATSADGKIHLTLWYWNRSIDDSLIAQVSKQFPNVVLNAQKISSYDNKVRTTMAGQSGVPDIMGINSNVATFFPAEDQFVDLNTLGAKEIESLYLPWKWKLATTPTGRQIAIPMDTGPTALFYRADIFEQAGLPTDPTEVTNLFKTWDDYLDAAEKIDQATGGKSFLIDEIYRVYQMQLASSAQQYFTPSGEYIGNQEHIKQMWDTAVKFRDIPGANSKTEAWTSDWNKSANNGRFVSFIGAVWMKQILAEAAPDTKGKWRIARAPGADGNNGGSFMAVSKYSQHPKEAFEVIKWLQSPENQIIAYNNIQLFPSAISALSDPSLNQPEEFFGGQVTTEIFSVAAQNIPAFYSGPNDGKVDGEMSLKLRAIMSSNGDSEQAWQEVQQTIQRVLLR